MELVKISLYIWISSLCIVYCNGQVCNDLDTEVCKKLESLNPNMCADSCLSSICTRHCGHCPLKCYECHEIDDPSNCTNLVDCPSNEHHCFTTQTFTDDFREVYKMGCAMKTLCEQNVHAKRSDLHVNGGCCNWDKCNNVLPAAIDLLPKRTTMMVQTSTAAPSENAICANMDEDVCLKISLADPSFCSNDCIASNICPRMCRKCFQCYECNDIDRPELCNTTSTCQGTKECFQLETLSVDLRPVYRMGCLDETLCQRFHAPVQTGFGKRQLGISLKGGCCKTDLCNSDLSKIATMPPTMPPTTTTPKPTHSVDCLNNLVGHIYHQKCPDGYSYFTHTRSCYKVGDQIMTWQDSLRYCEKNCGHLADFSSHDELDYVLGHVGIHHSRGDFYWTDGRRDTHGHWTWEHSHQAIPAELSRYLSRSQYSCSLANRLSSKLNIDRLVADDCRNTHYPLCETHHL